MLNIVNESILDQKVDAIVNPANSHLAHGGGLARIIADQAAPYKSIYEAMSDMEGWFTSEAWRGEQENHDLIATGAAGHTSAGALPFKGIIHAVGPVWGGGEFFERELVHSAYLSACAVAEKQGYTSVAFPAISMGIFKVPRDVVEEEAYWGVLDFARRYDVTICLTNDEDRDAFRNTAVDLSEVLVGNPVKLGWI